MKRLLLIFSILFFSTSVPALAVDYVPYTVYPLEDTYSYKTLNDYVNDELLPAESTPVTEEDRKVFADALEVYYTSASYGVDGRLVARKDHFITQMNVELAAKTVEKRAEGEVLNLNKANWYGPSKAAVNQKYFSLERQQKIKARPLKRRQARLRIRVRKNLKTIWKSNKKQAVKRARKRARQLRAQIGKIGYRVKIIERKTKARQRAALDSWREENYQRTLTLNQDLTNLAALLESERAAITTAWEDNVFAIEFPLAEDAFIQEKQQVDDLFADGENIIANMPALP